MSDTLDPVVRSANEAPAAYAARAFRALRPALESIYEAASAERTERRAKSMVDMAVRRRARADELDPPAGTAETPKEV